MYADVLSEIQALNDIHFNRDVLFGDFNIDLDCHSNLSVAVNGFIVHNQMCRCDLLFPTSDRNTYVNEASHTRSAIDYMFTSCNDKTIAFNILDLDMNLSDHLPIMSVCTRDLSSASLSCTIESQPTADVTHFRWDHAPL